MASVTPWTRSRYGSSMARRSNVGASDLGTITAPPPCRSIPPEVPGRPAEERGREQLQRLRPLGDDVLAVEILLHGQFQSAVAIGRRPGDLHLHHVAGHPHHLRPVPLAPI